MTNEHRVVLNMEEIRETNIEIKTSTIKKKKKSKNEVQHINIAITKEG